MDFFHLSLSKRTSYFVDAVPLKNCLLENTLTVSVGRIRMSFASDVTCKNWQRSFVCMCVCLHVCTLHPSACGVSTDLINREPTEHRGTTVTSPRESIPHPHQHLTGSLASQTHVNQLHSFGQTPSGASQVVDKFTHCLESERWERDVCTPPPTPIG